MRSTRDILNGNRRGLRPAAALQNDLPVPLRPPDTGVCPICHDAQWLRADVPFGHPQFGRLIHCECLLEKEETRRVRENRSLSQLSGLEERTFESFDKSVDGVEAAFATARAFADEPDGWLVMTGRVGSGKTHLAVAIANAHLEMGTQTVMFTVVPDLLDHLRATFDPSRGIDYDDRFSLFRNAFLLVLDDLGTENTTPWAKEKLFQIINHRYNERLPTVITTNRPFAEIDERIVSRMLDRSLSRTIVFDRAEDFRQRGQPGYVRGRPYRPFR